jgi:hypothetical protein
MSGGPTANGNGYTGVVHGSSIYEKTFNSLAHVIPFESIVRECISQLKDSSQADFPTRLSWPHVKILKL